MIIVNIPMTLDIRRIQYDCKGSGLKSSDKAVAYPVNAFLEKNLRPEDTVTCLLIVKHSIYSKSEDNIRLFREELEEINQSIGARIDYSIIDSEFEENWSVYERLMSQIVEYIKDESHITVDMTYGPKDLPIVEFSALNFAEKFLGCRIDHILYGQGFFNENQELVGGQLCDMSPLYSLNSLTNSLSCTNAGKARSLLRTLIAI